MGLIDTLLRIDGKSSSGRELADSHRDERIRFKGHGTIRICCRDTSDRPPRTGAARKVRDISYRTDEQYDRLRLPLPAV